MSNTCNAIGANGKILLQDGASPRTFSNASTRLIFALESLTSFHQWSGRRRGIGESSATSDAVRRFRSLAYGTIVTPLSPEALHLWLPLAMWGPVTSNVADDSYELGDQASSRLFDLLIDRENKVFRYTDCVVNKLTIISRASDQIPKMTIEIAALLEDQATSWPSPEPDYPNEEEHSPYTHWESTFVLNGVDVATEQFMFQINNYMKPQGFSSVTAQCFRSNGRSISLTGSGSFVEASQDVMTAAVDTTADATLSFSHSLFPMSTAFNFTRFRNEGYKSPTIRDSSQIPLQFNLTASKVDSVSPELSVTNDHTP